MSSIGRKLARQVKRDTPELTPEEKDATKAEAKKSSLNAPQTQNQRPQFNAPRPMNQVRQRRSGNA